MPYDPNPMGQLKPGQGFLSRPGMGPSAATPGAPSASPGATYLDAQRPPAAPRGGPSSAVAPGARAPSGPSGGGPTGGYAPSGAKPGAFFNRGASTTPAPPSGGGAYGTGQAGQYVDAMGKPMPTLNAFQTDAFGQGETPTNLYAQAQGIAPEDAVPTVVDGMAQQAQQDQAALQSSAGAVPGGTGPKPAGTTPPGGGTWADHGFTQQPDGSWVYGGTGTPSGGGQPPAGGGTPPPGGAPPPAGGGSFHDTPLGGFGTPTPGTPPPGGQAPIPGSEVEPGAILNPETGQWERNVERGGDNFEQYLRARGSPYAGDPFGLPGKPTAMYAGLEAYSDLANEQMGRATESEGMWRELMDETAGGPGYAAAGKVAGDLAEDPYTTSSDELRGKLQRRGEEDIEGGRNTTRQRMADLGITSGPAGAEAVLGAEGAANRQRTDFDLALDTEFAKRRGEDVTRTMGAAEKYGDIHQQARVSPSAAYAAMRRSPLEPYRETLADLYTQLGTFQSEEELARSSQGSNELVGVLGAVASGFPEELSIGSDIRIKEDVEPTGEVLRGGIPVVTFRYIGESERRVGVIAQDVERVYPEAVHEVRGIKHVNYRLLRRLAA